MIFPRRPASAWWAALLLTALGYCPVVRGQINITAHRQDPVIPRAYVGADIPKGLGVYMVSTCNTGASEASVYVDAVVSTLPGVQDGAAVLYAARTHKGGTWKVTAYRIGGAVAMAAGGFASAGATTLLGQIAGGVGGAAGVSAMLSGRAADLSRLDVPANWWTPDPTRTAALHPGQCMAPLLVALTAADATFERKLPLIASGLIKETAPNFKLPGVVIAPVAIIETTQKGELAVRTHPEVDPFDVVDAEAAARADWLVSRIRARGDMQ